jgi:hypothetical protein
MIMIVGFTGFIVVNNALTIYKIRRRMIDHPKDPGGSTLIGITMIFILLLLTAVASILAHYMTVA